MLLKNDISNNLRISVSKQNKILFHHHIHHIYYGFRILIAQKYLRSENFDNGKYAMCEGNIHIMNKLFVFIKEFIIEIYFIKKKKRRQIIRISA